MTNAAKAPSGDLRSLQIVALGAVTPLALLAAPALGVQLHSQYGLGDAAIGRYFLVELGGLSAASLPALWWRKRVAPARACMVAASLFILANLASVFASTLPVLMVLRGLGALAGGTLLVQSMAMAAAHERPDRQYGLWVLGQLIAGAATLWLAPHLFARFGLGAFYVLMAAVMAAALPLVARLPNTGAASQGRADGAAPGSPLRQGAAMLALSLFYIAIGGVWAFVSLIGVRAGLVPAKVGDAVALASLSGVAGAGLASLTAGRWPRVAALVGGMSLLIAAMAGLGLVVPLGAGDGLRLLISVAAFKFGWTFTLPSLLGVVAAQDRSGRIMEAANLFIGAANALGPLVIGSALQGLGVGPALAIGVAGFALAAILLVRLDARAP
jgi:predicted MFS family arabinose efflux permease